MFHRDCIAVLSLTWFCFTTSFIIYSFSAFRFLASGDIRLYLFLISCSIENSHFSTCISLFYLSDTDYTTSLNFDDRDVCVHGLGRIELVILQLTAIFYFRSLEKFDSWIAKGYDRVQSLSALLIVSAIVTSSSIVLGRLTKIFVIYKLFTQIQREKRRKRVAGLFSEIYLCGVFSFGSISSVLTLKGFIKDLSAIVGSLPSSTKRCSFV